LTSDIVTVATALQKSLTGPSSCGSIPCWPWEATHS